MALDEGVLQHQRLKLAGDEDGIEMVYLGYHLPCFSRVGGAVLKVLAHPVFQLFGFAHIDNFSGFIHHQVYAGMQGQGVGLFL